MGTFLGERELDKGLGLVDRIRADLIVVTGDIVDSDPRFVPIAARRLGALRAREGIVCIPGNHDYYTGASVVLEGMRRAGIDVLLNRGKVIAEPDGGFALLGVDDLWSRNKRRDGGPDLDRARSSVRPDLATVLLAHQPRRSAVGGPRPGSISSFPAAPTAENQSGFRPIDLFYEYVAGRYDVGPCSFTNRGFAPWSAHARPAPDHEDRSRCRVEKGLLRRVAPDLYKEPIWLHVEKR